MFVCLCNRNSNSCRSHSTLVSFNSQNTGLCNWRNNGRLLKHIVRNCVLSNSTSAIKEYQKTIMGHVNMIEAFASGTMVAWQPWARAYIEQRSCEISLADPAKATCWHCESFFRRLAPWKCNEQWQCDGTLTIGLFIYVSHFVPFFIDACQSFHHAAKSWTHIHFQINVQPSNVSMYWLCWGLPSRSQIAKK